MVRDFDGDRGLLACRIGFHLFQVHDPW
jgi:hypothetical protein